MQGGARMSRLIEQLRQRRVVRTLLIYLAACWMVLQVAEVVVPSLGLPPGITTVLLIVAIAGIPVAFGLTWAYEATHEGVRRAGDRAGTIGIAELNRWLSWRTIIATAVLIGIGVAIGFVAR